MKASEKYIVSWLNICCFAISLMIIVGGITRLTQSGLSIVEWKPLTGILPPLNEKQWEESFNQYKLFPEYQKVNQFKFMNLDEYKNIYFWEYLHRILGRVIGLLFIIPLIYFYIKKYLDDNFAKKILFAIILVGIQGVIGWYMVISGLVDNPHVSHLRLALHLVLAFLLLAYVYWIKLSVINDSENITDTQHLKHINCILFIFIIQIIFGAFVAGTKAGRLWNTFPLIDGQLFPFELISMKPLYLNFINNMMMFQFMHRIIAIILVAYCIYFFFKTTNERYSKYTGLLFMVIVNQFIIGVITLLTKVQINLGVLHQCIAIILMLLIIQIKHSIIYGNTVK